MTDICNECRKPKCGSGCDMAIFDNVCHGHTIGMGIGESWLDDQQPVAEPPAEPPAEATLTRWERDGYGMVKSTDGTYGFYEAADVDDLLRSLRQQLNDTKELIAARARRIVQLEEQLDDVKQRIAEKDIDTQKWYVIAQRLRNECDEKDELLAHYKEAETALYKAWSTMQEDRQQIAALQPLAEIGRLAVKYGEGKLAEEIDSARFRLHDAIDAHIAAEAAKKEGA